jgi:hypothetical protein
VDLVHKIFSWYFCKASLYKMGLLNERLNIKLFIY